MEVSNWRLTTANLYVLISTLVSEVDVLGTDKWIHPTIYCRMQLLIRVWDTRSWRSSPYISYTYKKVNKSYSLWDKLHVRPKRGLVIWHSGASVQRYFFIFRDLCTFIESKLKHWGRDKMAGIFQTTFSNTFSWIKIMHFYKNFIEVC